MYAVPQSGPITSRVPLAAYALERHLVFNSHVVTKDEAVEALLKRALRLAPHAWTGNREEGQIDEGVFAERRVKRRCGEIHERSRSCGYAGRGERRFHDGEFFLRRLRALRLHGENEVVRTRALRLVCEQADRCELLQIHRRAHEDHRLADARPLAGGGADAHELHRIVVRAGEDANGYRHFIRSPESNLR